MRVLAEHSGDDENSKSSFIDLMIKYSLCCYNNNYVATAGGVPYKCSLLQKSSFRKVTSYDLPSTCMLKVTHIKIYFMTKANWQFQNGQLPVAKTN